MSDIATDFATALANKFAKKIYEKKAQYLIFTDTEYELQKGDTGTTDKITCKFINDNLINKIYIDNIKVYDNTPVTDWNITYNGNTANCNPDCGTPFYGVTTIHWGDGTSETYEYGAFTHTYTTPGEYTVGFVGTSQLINFNAFKECTNITKIQFNDDLKYIYDSAFEDCTNLTEVNFPGNLEVINQNAFTNCKKLKQIEFYSITSLLNSAFSYCIQLEKIIFPENLLAINDECFYGCDSLQEITFKSTNPPTVGELNFNYMSGGTIRVPLEALEAYKATENMPDPADNTYIGY